MSDDTCWETKPKAGWDEYTRARERFFAQAWSRLPAQHDTPPGEATPRPPCRDEGTLGGLS
jgi:hypothetical protein